MFIVLGWKATNCHQLVIDFCLDQLIRCLPSSVRCRKRVDFPFWLSSLENKKIMGLYMVNYIYIYCVYIYDYIMDGLWHEVFNITAEIAWRKASFNLPHHGLSRTKWDVTSKKTAYLHMRQAALELGAMENPWKPSYIVTTRKRSSHSAQPFRVAAKTPK